MSKKKKITYQNIFTTIKDIHGELAKSLQTEHLGQTFLQGRVQLTLFWKRNKQNENFVQSYWPQLPLPS